MRADLLEGAILQDVEDVFRDERFVARVWEEANRRLSAEKPSVEREIGNVETQIAKERATIERYLEAFEAEGTNPQEKDLLHRLVNRFLVHDRRTIEIWYALPNQASVRTPAHLAPHGERRSNVCAGSGLLLRPRWSIDRSQPGERLRMRRML